MLAAVVERDARGGPREAAYRGRHQNLARRGDVLHPRRELNSAALGIVALTDDVTGVDADV